MPNNSGYARCPVCQKERQTTGTGRMTGHNRWDEKKGKMVYCLGSLQRPAKRLLR